jgi:phosphatidylserine/phosphatidylglycerophosphate/cardiolipin synthase-like enzyme
MTTTHHVATKVLGICTMACALLWAPCQAQASTHPVTRLESSIVDHTPAHLTEAIDHAKQSVQLAIYTFVSTAAWTDSKNHQVQPSVIQALTNAKKRGVKVTILYNHFTPQNYDPAYHIHHATENKEKKWCQAHHITCYPSSAGFHHSHQKYMIIDQQHAYVMTGNLPWCRHHGPCAINFSYHVQTPKAIAYLVTLFASDVRNSQQQTTNTPIPTSPWLVSPLNTEQGIIQFMSATQHQLDITQPFIQQRNHIPHAILKALDHLLARHVSVRLITNVSKSQHLNHALLKLSQRYPNFNIHCISGSPFIHAKTMVQDHKRMLLGSANWSRDALYHNRELGMIIHDRSYIRGIEQSFQALLKL